MPSDPPPAVSVAPVQWPAVTWAAVPAGTLVNVLLGAWDAPSDIMIAVKWGIYAGEYMLLVIWVSWGPGPHASRFCATIVTGSFWMLASWTAWFAFRMRHGVFGRELEQMLTLVPPAFAISTILIWSMRMWGWRFHWPRVVSPPPFPLAIRFLAFVLPAVWFRLSVGFFQQDDLLWSAVLGLLLGAVALLAAPWLSLAFLAKDLKPWWLLPAFVLVPAPGLVLASQFPIPSGGGSAHLYDSAFVASVTALAMMTLAFMLWRWIGIRNSADAMIRVI